MNPLVSIVVVTYLESNQKYLDLCLKSIENLSLPKEAYEVILVSSGEYTPNKHPVIKEYMHSQGRLHYPEAINWGITHTNPESKYLLILNDDVILTKDSISNMAAVVQDMDVIAGPISNCDNHAKYGLMFGYTKDDVYHPVNKRFYRYEEWPDHVEMMNMMSQYPPGMFPQQFLCFYCTLIPRKVWNKVGTLDDRFKTGQDDLDYSKRCLQQGVTPIVVLNSLVWHFGGVSADQALTNEIRLENVKYYRQKWNEDPL